ncbi:Porphobilinogen deaminase [Zancudomyces culisetae]|uniref:hydroxymethylbilane synthase n=1 Tax=Zancudomyces culisetae TaxID=1213189 RepID=A0A1R1PNW9_ZANCU|nr:Porphobilinogen deaminase [Zancudomyces culisetae]|eukprot:OMH82641.1 Porphobilinogen deaminase [Zancudomyces culisetae]
MSPAITEIADGKRKNPGTMKKNEHVNPSDHFYRLREGSVGSQDSNGVEFLGSVEEDKLVDSRRRTKDLEKDILKCPHSVLAEERIKNQSDPMKKTFLLPDSSAKPSFSVGSRESALALVQTNHVISCLKKEYPTLEFPLLTMATIGDKVLDVALAKIGEKSLFTKELEVALAQKQVDLVVHSLKDLPTTLPPGMKIGAILQREDPRDAVIMNPKYSGFRLSTLPKGSIRGNLNTRFKKLDAEDSVYAALVLAVAGVRRMGWEDRISEFLDPQVSMKYAVGQGALAVEVRDDDYATMSLIKPLIHNKTMVECTAERALMRKLEGGCSIPIGVSSRWILDPSDISSITSSSSSTEQRKSPPTHYLFLSAIVLSLDGSKVAQAEITEEFVFSDNNADVQDNPHCVRFDNVVDDRHLAIAEEIGYKLADKLITLGAKDILKEISNVPLNTKPT